MSVDSYPARIDTSFAFIQVPASFLLLESGMADRERNQALVITSIRVFQIVQHRIGSLRVRPTAGQSC